jgi:hypothetical protein
VKKPKADGPVPCLLDVFDVARHLKMHPETARRLIRSGRLPGIRLERSLYVDERDLIAYLEAGRLRPGASGSVSSDRRVATR